MTKHDGRDGTPPSVEGPDHDVADTNDPSSEVWAHRLAEEARTQRQEDDRLWEAVASGGGEVLPPNVDVAALRPLDPSERERLVEDLLGPPRAEVVDLGARRRARWVSVVWVAAAAAAIAVFFVLPSAPTLPSYTLTATGGDRAFRSSDDQPAHPVYSQGATMELVLTPSQATESEVAVGAVLIAESGPDRVWQPPLQRGRDGAIRIRARIGQELQLAPGEWELRIVIAAPGELPTDLRSEPDGARRLVHRFRISNDD